MNAFKISLRVVLLEVSNGKKRCLVLTLGCDGRVRKIETNVRKTKENEVEIRERGGDERGD